MKIETTRMGTSVADNQNFAELVERPSPNIHYQLLGTAIKPLNFKSWNKKTKSDLAFITTQYRIECDDISKFVFDVSHIINCPARYEIISNKIKNWP